MSRGPTSKGRTPVDKTSRNTAPQTPTTTHDIIPGKFNDKDWNSILDDDGTMDFITDLVEELMDKTMAMIFNKYIESQLLPFTITQARDAIIEIIEWQFLARDPGEIQLETDAGWAEDEEPESAVTDCWAQGSIPRNKISAPAPPIEVITEEAESEAVKEYVDQMVNEAMEELHEQPDIVSDTDEYLQVEQVEDMLEEQEGSQDTSIKLKFKYKHGYSRVGRKKASVLKSVEHDTTVVKTESVFSVPSEDKPSTFVNIPVSCSNILKASRPQGAKDAVYDDYGNIIAVLKLDPEKLPNHKVNVKYHIVDSSTEPTNARLDVLRKGKPAVVKNKKMKSVANIHIEQPAEEGTKPKSARPTQPSTPITLKSSATSAQSSGADIEYHPTMIEEMEVSHGVTVREKGRIKKGPGRYYRKLDILDENQKGMRPVNLRITNPGITVADLLDRHTPILRPLGESSPLPPIVLQPPQNSQQVS